MKTTLRMIGANWLYCAAAVSENIGIAFHNSFAYLGKELKPKRQVRARASRPGWYDELMETRKRSSGGP